MQGAGDNGLEGRFVSFVCVCVCVFGGFSCFGMTRKDANEYGVVGTRVSFVNGSVETRMRQGAAHWRPGRTRKMLSCLGKFAAFDRCR